MTNPNLEVAISLEVYEDWPVADLFCDGINWASMTYDGQTVLLTVFAAAENLSIPMDAALEWLSSGRARLMAAIERSGNSPA